MFTDGLRSQQIDQVQREELENVITDLTADLTANLTATPNACSSAHSQGAATEYCVAVRR